MTKEELEEKIEGWALERRFDSITFNQDSLNGNIFEELAEKFTAYSEFSRGNENAIYEIVDAICDGLIYQIADMVKIDYDIEQIKVYEDNYALAYVELLGLGFNIEKSLEETLKEISSRNGTWNDDLMKWQKCVSQPKETLYIANYSKCRIDSKNKKYKVQLQFNVSNTDMLDVEVEAKSKDEATKLAILKYENGDVDPTDMYASSNHDSNLDSNTEDWTVEEL